VAITLGAVTFDEALTAVREHHEEVGGRDARQIEISGVVKGTSVSAIEAALDALLAAASDDECVTPLSIRPGRRLLVRRIDFRREIACKGLTGSFALKLEAQDPFEESTDEHLANWTVQASGESVSLSNAGTAAALPVISLTASGAVISPAFSDGPRSIVYNGIVQDGQALTFDAASQRVTLDGVDVTPHTRGLFPLLLSGESTLTYADDEASSHAGVVEIRYRDRWW